MNISAELKDKLLRLAGYRRMLNASEAPSEKVVGEAAALKNEILLAIKADNLMDDLTLLITAGILVFTYYQDPAAISFTAESAMLDDEEDCIHILNFGGWSDITDPPPVMEFGSEAKLSDTVEQLPN